MIIINLNFYAMQTLNWHVEISWGQVCRQDNKIARMEITNYFIA